MKTKKLNNVIENNGYLIKKQKEVSCQLNNKTNKIFLTTDDFLFKIGCIFSAEDI